MLLNAAFVEHCMDYKLFIKLFKKIVKWNSVNGIINQKINYITIIILI